MLTEFQQSINERWPDSSIPPYPMEFLHDRLHRTDDQHAYLCHTSFGFRWHVLLVPSHWTIGGTLFQLVYSEGKTLPTNHCFNYKRCRFEYLQLHTISLVVVEHPLHSHYFDRNHCGFILTIHSDCNHFTSHILHRNCLLLHCNSTNLLKAKVVEPENIGSIYVPVCLHIIASTMIYPSRTYYSTPFATAGFTTGRFCCSKECFQPTS